MPQGPCCVMEEGLPKGTLGDQVSPALGQVSGVAGEVSGVAGGAPFNVLCF